MPEAVPFLSTNVIQQFQYPIELVIYHNHVLVAQWQFDIPPTSIQYQEPLRANVQQGINTAYVDRYGASLPTVTIEWTTSTGPGALTTGSSDADGYTHFLRLVQQILRGYYTETMPDTFGTWSMHLYDYPHQQYMEVVPLTNTWTQHTPENLALSSSLSFVVLGFLTAPHPPARTASQVALVDIPGQWIQSALAHVLDISSALGGYLNPNSLTGIQAQIWAQSAYQSQWETADYQEWFANPMVTSAQTQGLSQFVTQTVSPLIVPLLSNPSLPYPVSYADLTSAWQTAQSWRTTVRSLTPYPYWVGSLTSRLSAWVGTMTIAPNLFLP